MDKSLKENLEELDRLINKVDKANMIYPDYSTDRQKEIMLKIFEKIESVPMKYFFVSYVDRKQGILNFKVKDVYAQVFVWRLYPEDIAETKDDFEYRGLQCINRLRITSKQRLEYEEDLKKFMKNFLREAALLIFQWQALNTREKERKQAFVNRINRIDKLLSVVKYQYMCENNITTVAEWKDSELYHKYIRQYEIKDFDP